MEPEKEVNFFDLIREFNRQEIRYLLIGRRAVILYGGPVLTADHDLWIHPADKQKALHLLLEKGVELSYPPNTTRPIVTGYSGLKKYDLFFQKSVKNIENETIDFEECYKASITKEDAAEEVRFRIPSVDDLIRLKKIRKPNAKDEQDIEFLLKAKHLFKKSRSK